MNATLVGPPGSQCGVSISNVDGGSDLSILSVGAGSFHDNVVLEFVSAAPALTAFIAQAKPAAIPRPAKKNAHARRKRS
jgi:hypothetical protein